VLTDQDMVKERWKEHFSDLYNPKTNSDEKVLDECPVGGRSAEVPADIMKEEIEEAINRLKKNRSPGIDNISAEERQAAGQSGVDVMFLWDKEKLPLMWKQSIIVPLFKKKDKLCCDNYRGVSLLSHCRQVAQLWQRYCAKLERFRLTSSVIRKIVHKSAFLGHPMCASGTM